MRLLKMAVAIASLVSASAFASDLDGRWADGCNSSQGQYSSNVFVFTGNQVSLVSVTAQDAACSKKIIEVSAMGSIEGLEAGSPNMNMIFTSFLLAPFNDQVISYFNQNKFCGYSDWKAGEAKEILGHTCGDQVVTDKMYTIYEINSAGELRFGKMDDSRSGNTPESRPTELDPVPFRKI